MTIEDALIRMQFRVLKAEGERDALKAHVRTLREALEYVWGELEAAEPIDVSRYQEAKRQTRAALAATEEGK